MSRARIRNAISDRRLSKMHVIESEPAQVIRIYPKENEKP